MTDISAADPSASPPIDMGIRKWSEEWWANVKPETQARRCKAHRTDGERCRRLALNFQAVCAHHGGRAKNSVNAARRRMMEQADPAVRQLQKIAFDETNPLDIRFKATMAIIDRVGLAPRTSVELEVNPRPFEAVFEQMEYGGSRAEYRGEPELIEPVEPEQYELPPADDDVIDVEIEPEPFTPDESEHGLDDDSSPFSSTPPPPDGLMSYDAAVSAAKIHQARRALPRGRS
jgi:hypothetical protein